MIQLMISWLYVFMNVLIWGLAIKKIIKILIKKDTQDYDLLLIMGLAMLTTYAQIFSLFYKVGALAQVVLVVLDIFFFLFARDEISELISYVKKNKGIKMLAAVIVVLGAAAIVALESSGANTHYDTELYHAQAIRWIEEYGVVKGLGNLFFRAAYNSSFLCLQALFGLKCVFGQSLRNMNGFCAVFLAFITIGSLKMWKRGTLAASDIMKLLLVVIIGLDYYYYPSDSTDLFTLNLGFWIFAKWASYMEEDIDDPVPYSLLSILILYAITLKFSAGFMIVLAVKPAYLLLKDKKWKDIACYVVWGLIVLVPFLVRGVLISGYLLYPYAQLDLFAVDWKMAASTAQWDMYEIRLWGRSMQYSGIKDPTFRQWFPVWFHSMKTFYKVIVAADFLLIPLGVIRGEYRALSKKKWDTLLIRLAGISCFLGWFLSAPLLRYGKVWALLLFAMPVSEFVAWICVKWEKSLRNKKIYKGFLGVCVVAAIVLFLFRTLKYDYGIAKAMVKGGKFTQVVKQSDYVPIETTKTKWEGVYVYLQQTKDWLGYCDFPTCHEGTLKVIELRGTTLRDGFRLKKN